MTEAPNDVLATSPGHAVKRGLTHQCAVGLGPRVLRSGYQHDLRRRPSFFAMFRDERARGLAVKLTKSWSIYPKILGSSPSLTRHTGHQKRPSAST